MIKDIELGKIYNCFDDGKIRHSRKMEVRISEIIPYDRIDVETKVLWKQEMETCYWLYKTITDYFIKGVLKITNDKYEEVVFVRTLNNTWFSLGDWGGILDVDGSLTYELNNI